MYYPIVGTEGGPERFHLGVYVADKRVVGFYTSIRPLRRWGYYRLARTWG